MNIVYKLDYITECQQENRFREAVIIGLSGSIGVEIADLAQNVYLNAVYPYDDQGNPQSAVAVIESIRQKGVQFGLQEELVFWYLARAESEKETPVKVLIASGNPGASKGSYGIKFAFEGGAEPENKPFWEAIRRLFSHCRPMATLELPYKLKYCRANEVVAYGYKLEEDIPGKNTLGEIIPPSRRQWEAYEAGNGIFYDRDKERYIAREEGWLVLENRILYIHQPFHLSEDRMELYYIDLPQIENREYSNECLYDYCRSKNISPTFLLNNPEKMPSGCLLLARGKQPEPPQDAEVTYYYHLARSIGKVDENDRIDWKERDFFYSVLFDDVLAEKIKAKPGMMGQDLTQRLVPPRPPRDIPLRGGTGTRLEESEEKVRIMADADGILEEKNEVISVFSVARIKGDIDYSTGNLRVLTGLEVGGSLLAGFSVEAKHGISISGNVEDNTMVKAGADVLVKGGIIGDRAVIHCDGSLFAKFITGAKIYCKGPVTVEKFIMGADIECGDNITVMGRGININERGAIVDCRLKTKYKVITPSVGNESGQPTEICFGWDAALAGRINDLRETLAKLSEGMAEARQAHKKDELQALSNKYEMLEQMLRKALLEENDIFAQSGIIIQKKVFPPLLMTAGKIRKTVFDVGGACRWYYDLEDGVLRRSTVLYAES